MNTELKIILGSSSRWRQQVLRQAGIPFTVETADIDEKAIRHANAAVLTCELAKAKASAILKKIPVSESLLITCDQVVVCNDVIREKPESSEQAREFLRGYAQFPAYCVNGVAVTFVPTGDQLAGNQISKITFNPIPNEVIEELIAEGVILNSAGAFTCEHPLLKPYIKEIENGEDGILGLPLKFTLELMSEFEYLV